ncbi:hypothetical protein [Streptomyces coeruleorubidus]|uniref:hypothetical protein n=1 Tax=Streptomyces coeruleorubidus TaxID=116188 RepID=UPI0033AFABBC
MDLDHARELQAAANRLREQVTYVVGIADEAKRQKAEDSREGYFVGISGGVINREDTRTALSTFHVDGEPMFTITPVTNVPDIGSLARALAPKFRSTFSHLGHLSHQVDHELYIAKRIAHTPQGALNLAYQVISLLRLRGKCMINGITFSNTPWSQVAAHTGDVFLQPLEDPRSPLWESEKGISQGDLDWAAERLIRDFDLREQPSYRLAYESAADAPFLKDTRTAVARIWSGIESLFDVQNELSFRLSMYAAVLISDDVAERIAIQTKFKRLYGLRSKAVHGAKMDDAKLAETLISSWSLLRDLLLACIRTGPSVPLTAELDRALLGHRLARDEGCTPSPYETPS